MSRVSFLLMIAVMASALYLVRTQYESRSPTAHREAETAKAHRE